MSRLDLDGFKRSDKIFAMVPYHTCWRGPLLVHGNYESSLVYFCVYMKDTVCSSLCRSELLNSSSF